jgi:lipopolysaccharide/colanic/teichoic acid biosynthesis glycosyltransferase
MIRSVGSHQDRLDLDLRYIRDQNWWVDVKVMWLTLGRLSGKGGN